MRLKDLGEDAFLRELQKRFPAAGAKAVLGIGDDAAIVDPPEGERLLLTTDSLVEGVHFSRKWMPPRYLGRKSVAVNASDIAAMGGDPLYLLLSLGVPRDGEVEPLWALVEGVYERARELGMSLVGGNLASSPAGVVVDVTVVGATIARRALRRAGATPGDGIYLSGRIGASSTGLKLLEQGAVLAPGGGLIVPESLRGGPVTLAEDCIRAHIDPEPRIGLGAELNRGRLATAAIDVSDGLALDLHRLCRASGVGARIEEAALPIAPGLLAWARLWKRNPTQAAVSGGEDYELLFTGRGGTKLERLRERGDFLVTRIGEITAGESVEIVGRDGSARPLTASGWDHFGNQPG
jgi:thiamine-monophosphate kinase